MSGDDKIDISQYSVAATARWQQRVEQGKGEAAPRAEAKSNPISKLFGKVSVGFRDAASSVSSSISGFSPEFPKVKMPNVHIAKPFKALKKEGK